MTRLYSYLQSSLVTDSVKDLLLNNPTLNNLGYKSSTHAYMQQSFNPELEDIVHVHRLFQITPSLPLYGNLF